MMSELMKMQRDHKRKKGIFKEDLFIPTMHDIIYTKVSDENIKYYSELISMSERILIKDNRKEVYDLFKIPVSLIIVLTMALILLIGYCSK